MLQLDTETKITRFVKGQNLSVPLGVPAQPAIPANGPYFSNIMQNGLLCYTGTATGALAQEDCKCELADEMAASASDELRQRLKKVAADVFEFENQGDATGGRIVEDFIENTIRNALNEGTDVCSQLTHLPSPATVFPSREAYETFIKNNLTSSDFHLRTIGIVGRQCFNATVGTTAAQRSSNPPKMAPWEYRYTDSGASACNCRDPIEHRSESFSATSDIAHNYLQALAINRALKSNGQPRGNPERPPAKPQKQLSSCVYFRSGYAFQNADLAMVTPLLQGASSTVNLTLLSRESNVPFFPGATHEQEEVCGGMGITERINSCFFGLLDDFSTELLPSQDDIDKLSATCASTNEELKPFQQKCCHKVRVYTRDDDVKPALRPIIRLDMMRAVQCRRVKESVNSGDGRMHTYKPTAFSRPADMSYSRREGSAMPDLAAETTNHIRRNFKDSGYHETCLLPGQQELQCQELGPATFGSDDITAAGRPAGEGLTSGGDTTRGATDNSNYRSNKIDDAKAQRTLRRSRALLNTCHLPGVYADGTPVAIDACSVAALFGLQPQIFNASQAGRGYTDDSFRDCRQEEVPAIVEAYYRWKYPADQLPAPSKMLIWWAKNRPSFYHGSASVPLVLSDFLVYEENGCLKNAPGRQQPPEGEPTQMASADIVTNIKVEVNGECTTRPSCCPGAGDGLTDDQCDQLCTDGMDPLEHTKANLGARMWAKIITQCASSNPNDKAFCKFAGQHSFDANVWQPTSDPQPLFQNVGSPGQRLCISEASENERLFVYQNIYVGRKLTKVAVFQTASPRTRSSVFHPIAQGTGSVGFGGVNYTEITDPDVPGWTQSSADPGTQSIKVVDGTGAPTISIMPTLEQPVGGSFAYRGTEAAAVASTACYNENHRGAGAEGGPIRMPGLFPRTMDLEMGWGKVDSCAELKGNDVIQALADQPLLDLTGRGGGSSPQFASVDGGIYAWATGTDAALQNSGLWIQANDDHGGEVMADSGGLVCATQEPNRCVGPCDLTKAIVTGVVGGLEVVLGAELNPFSDFGLFTKALGLMSAVGGGSSIMDAAGSSSGSVGLTPVSKVLNARLTDTADDSFLVRTTLAQTDDLLGLYRTFPSMVWGCDPAAADGNCLGTDASLLPMTHATLENPISSNPDVSGTSQATMEAHDKWSASVSLQKSMTVGGNLACRSAMQPSGGGFKDSLGQIQVSHVQTYRSNSGSTLEFGIVDEATMAATNEGFLYTLLDGANNSAPLFPDRDASCSLCASIGSPHATTAVRDECNIDAPDGASTPTAFSLTMGVFVDTLAANVFPEDLSKMTKVCLYNFMPFGGDDTDGEIECSSDTLEETNPVDNLLGYHVKAQKPTRGPCFWSNDLVESCAFDSSLEVKTNYTLGCSDTPVDANTSCANPRWNNDRRVVFAAPVRTSTPNVRRLTTDFDPLALYTSYCANNWGVVDGVPFADPSWFRSPYGYTDDIPGAPNRSNVPRWLDNSTAYVYCAGDRLSPGARDAFCRGFGDQPEGRGTYEGLRLQNRQDLDEVCHDTGPRSHKCLLYAADPGPYAPEKMQTIVDTYQEDAVDVAVVPVNFTVVSWAALFLGTTYYNSASQAPPSERTEAGADTVVGRLLNISWAASTAMVEGMCTSTPDLEYFAQAGDPPRAAPAPRHPTHDRRRWQLYAWIELHRDGPAANTYTFFSLDTPTDRTARRTVTMTDREVYPGVKLPGTVFPRLARLTLRSAFSDAVAERASEIVGTGVALPPRWLHFHPSLVGARCTRFSAQLTATFEFLSFAMDGPCTRANPSDRVPIVYQGGSTVDNSTVKFCRCYACSAGLVSYRGSATTVEVTASPDLDTEHTVVGWSEMVPQTDTACAGNLTTCMNASLPGLSVSLARTVGAAAVVDCGLWSTPTKTDAGGSQIHDVYCDLATTPAAPAVSRAQYVGGPFSDGNGLPCSDACDANAECVWRDIRWTCVENRLSAEADDGDAESAACPWDANAATTTTTATPTGAATAAAAVPEPCVPPGWAFAEVGDNQYPPKLPVVLDTPSTLEIQQWAVAQILAHKAQRRCSAVGCPRAPQVADGGTCAAPLAGSDGLRQEWFLAADEAGVPIGVPFNGRRPPDGYGAAGPVFLRLPQRPGHAPEVYGTVSLRATSNDVGGGRFFVDGLRLGAEVTADDGTVTYNYDDGNCLSRSTRPTRHARLEAQPCSEGVPAQQWLFVWHPDRALWRLQSASPWECVTQTDPAEPDADAGAGGAGGADGGAAPVPVVVPCEACAVGVAQSDVVLPATTSIVVPELLPDQTGLDGTTTDALIPLSTANASLALRVDTATGLCVEHAPPATAPTLGAFVLGVVGADALTYVPCGLLFLAGRQQLEATYGPDVCRQEPIGALLKACGLDGGQLGLVDGTPADMDALCGASLADGPDHAPLTGLRWAATSADGGSGAVLACWPPARDPAHPASQMAPDQVGVGAGWSLTVEHGGHGFREGERLVLTGIGHGNAAPSDVRLYARVAKVVWQPFRAGLGSTPLVAGAEVINTTELYSIEGIGAVYALASAASRSALGTWTVVAVEIVTISVVLVVHVLSCFPTSIER